MLDRLGRLLTALVAFLVGSTLAWHYPLGQYIAPAVFVAASLLAYYRLSWFLVILPASLPVIGLAPWTGWMTFEEVDLIVLAMASGGYARTLVDGTHASSRRRSWLLPVFSFLMALSVLISMGRGFSDAGGFEFGWFQSYDGPMNSIRIGKSLILALLLIPLVKYLLRDPQQEVGRKLAWGLAIGLGAASLAAVWERLAFTDLLNFSSDYRSTALFWEMHVGGAALDGWLLLTAPFAVWALRNSRTNLQHAFSVGLIVVAAYAALTTFSRGVYLALMVALPVLAWQTRQHVGGLRQPDQLAWSPLRWTIALLTLGAMFFFVFSDGGYRGLMALLGVIAIGLSMPSLLRTLSIKQVVAGLLLGLVIGGVLVLLAGYVLKGAYVLYSALFVSMLVFVRWLPRSLVGASPVYCLAGFSALMLSAAHVAFHWGGSDALSGMSGALVVVLLVVLRGLFAAKQVWPNDLRWQATFMSSAVAVCAVVAVFLGGAYISERFATSEKDMDGRFDHWSLSTSMLQSPLDVAFGKGLGRYPANYFYAIPDSKFPGTYQIHREGENASLLLVAPRRGISFGDALRVSQRLGFDAVGPFEATLKIRARTGASVRLEVCEKHLLYAERCADGTVTVKPDTEWQTASIKFKGRILSVGSWYAPRIKMFSIAVINRSGTVEIDDVVLTSWDGENLLANSDFKRDMQYWFFTSDRDHMPWHAKNILVNVLFDQGIVGLVIFVGLLGVALFRLNLGGLREYELSPYLSSAIIGFLVVGMFDSLIDTPRLSLVFYFLLLAALMPNALNATGGRKRAPA